MCIRDRLQDEIPALRPHLNTLGPGVLHAIRAGFQEARAPYLLVLMADGSDDCRTIDAMVERARRGADVVVASRYMDGGRQLGGPLLKRLLSRLAGLSLYWLGALPVHDATNNFRLYSRRLLTRVDIESRAGFELALELTVKAHALGLEVVEVPTTWVDRAAGRSRFRLWRWLPQYLKWYRRSLLWRLAPVYRRPKPPHNP